MPIAVRLADGFYMLIINDIRLEKWNYASCLTASIAVDHLDRICAEIKIANDPYESIDCLFIEKPCPKCIVCFSIRFELFGKLRKGKICKKRFFVLEV